MSGLRALRSDTVTCDCVSHGYKLGEHCDWFKHDNYEDSTRIPVIVKPAADQVLGRAIGAGVGSMVEQLVEEVGRRIPFY